MSAVQVWTMLPEYEAVTPLSNRPTPNPANLDATHMRHKDVESDASLRIVYERFQEDADWPMAAGDVLVDHTGQAWMAIPPGFVAVHQGRPLRQRPSLRIVE
jgi:hypothetical protein